MRAAFLFCLLTMLKDNILIDKLQCLTVFKTNKHWPYKKKYLDQLGIPIWPSNKVTIWDWSIWQFCCNIFTSFLVNLLLYPIGMLIPWLGLQNGRLFKSWDYLIVVESSKGQIVSKELFGILEFSQKPNKWIRRSSKKKFVCSFFWENSRIPKVLSKLSDL